MKNRIQELRHKYDMTQEDLAQRVKVTRRTIISLESGKFNPSLELAFKLSETFGVPIEQIFIHEGGDDKK